MTFPQALEISQLSRNYTQADQALRTTIAQELYEAVSDGDHTTDAITWTSVSEADLLTIIKELRGQGYGVTEGSSTITITWTA